MNRIVKQGVLLAAVVSGVGVMGAGCLTRPVESANPNLKTNFTNTIENKVIDKIDLLFDIDNSASMGDKQQYLESAIPDLINRLINPNCIDNTTMQSVGASMNMGQCPANSAVEFPPVHNMHIGIVSSALGPRLGNVCPTSGMESMPAAPFSNLSDHNDDQAHLLNRSLTYSMNLSSATEATVGDASQGFLYWYPSTQQNQAAPVGTPVTMSSTLEGDFSQMVGGVGVFGCGIESQLETWYRFLIQPDPYATLALDSAGHGNWQGVDTTILQQRHDFLRPDSLVAIIVLTDEDDSEIDVRALGQQAYNWMSTDFNPPRGTSQCGTDGLNGNPGDPNCQSCAQSGTANDSACKMGPYSNPNDWGYDANLRHVHTKAKYGIDPQFPLARYLNGLTSPTVPDRDGEYPGSSSAQNSKGQWQITASSYQGKNDCTNPLFASALPDGSAMLNSDTLCKLPPGTRTKDLVFFAHIGGVPYQLLNYDANGNSNLQASDWVKIIGMDPQNYNYAGIDPHMIESFQPRTGISPTPPGAVATPFVPGPDPESGYDWVTNSGAGHVLNVDREYACIFPLADSNGNPTTRDCTAVQNQSFCDCPHMAGMVTAQQLPPICDPTTQTTQIGAKAYPTIRELELVNLMGNQGIVSSICPAHVAEQMTGDPLYGYRPAVASIINRLKTALTSQCLPEQLQVAGDGSVPCLILVQLPTTSGGSCKTPMCDNTMGLLGPGQTPMGGTGVTLDQDVLNQYCDSLEQQYDQAKAAAGSSATTLQDPAQQSVCALVQLTNTAQTGGTCKGSTQSGWCYVTGAAAGNCSQAIIFTNGTPPSGATTSLQCIEQSVGVLDGGASAVSTTTSSSSGTAGGSSSGTAAGSSSGTAGGSSGAAATSSGGSSSGTTTTAEDGGASDQ